MASQERNSQLTNIIQPDMFKSGLWSEVVSAYQYLPGLVGFWPFSSIQRSTGAVYDMSEQGRSLTRSGVFYGYSGLYPYVYNSAGTGYLYRADETDMRITGTESFLLTASKGMTVGGWFYVNAYSTSNQYAMAKTGTSGNLGWRLLFSRSGLDNYCSILATANGTTEYGASTSLFSTAYTAARWHFLVGRLLTGTSLGICLDNTWGENTTSGAALTSIYASTAQFTILSDYSGSQNLAGKTALCFVSAQYIPNSIISGIYQRSRLLFGV